MGRQTEKAKNTGPEAARRVRKAAERWRRAVPEGYDLETFSDLKRALDRDRPSYRKLFPEGDGGRES
ncbi:MAG: hypothetical protein H0U04_19270 [Rubrobacter sp.]|nr:hypothetical protein [Rubrobacter sp.]MDQ3315917.1 hypothetical protein [Actinomycetota bacterium]